MQQLIYCVILGCVIYYEIRKRKHYNKLFNASKNLLLKHHTEQLVDKMNYLQSMRGQADYADTFKGIAANLRNELSALPKDLQKWIWSDAVNKHDSAQPRAISSDGVWGRANYYNELKDAIGII